MPHGPGDDGEEVSDDEDEEVEEICPSCGKVKRGYDIVNYENSVLSESVRIECPECGPPAESLF